MATEGTFVLADIGGYTSFLSDVGIKHGKEITEHLLNRLIRSMRRDWKVANVMGDCVFFYSPQPLPPQQTFESLRSLYHAFRDAQLEVADGSTCRCGACDRTEELSLKFVVHAGEYDIQNIGGRKELIGRDVVLATRLLKNSVPVREYVIATAPVAGVAAAAGVAPTSCSDEVETIGRIEYAYIDLLPLREAYDRQREFYISASAAQLGVEKDIDAPADIVWANMSELAKRAVWQVTIQKMEHLQGETGAVGEVHSCLHEGGIKVIHVTIAVDNEGRRKTERVWVSPPFMKDTYITMAAEALSETRTRASLRAIFRPRFPVVSHIAWPFFFFMMKRSIRKDMAGLKELCETGAVAARAATAAKGSE